MTNLVPATNRRRILDREYAEAQPHTDTQDLDGGDA